MKKSNVSKLVVVSILLSLVVILQAFAPVIKIGIFSPTFALIPLVVGAIIFGPKVGTILGFAFGCIVSINCINGLDGGGSILFSASPGLTILVCLVKGTLTGFLSGLVFKLLQKKNNYVAIITASIIAPIVNTGLFCLAMPLFFYDILVSWAGGSNLLFYTLTGLIGLNFLFEFSINTILSPVVSRIIQIYKKTNN